MGWGSKHFFPCVTSSLMAVGGPWASGLDLNLTQGTICDTWLFILNLGSQRWLHVPNCPISSLFPPFHPFFFVFLRSPPPMVPSGCSLLLCPLALPIDLSSTHPHWAIPLPSTPQTASFFNTIWSLLVWVSCCWNQSAAPSLLQQGPWDELIATREEPESWLSQGWGTRAPRWRQGLDTYSKWMRFHL